MGVELYVAGLLSGLALAELVAWSRGRLRLQAAQPAEAGSGERRRALLEAAADLDREWKRALVKYPLSAARYKRHADALREEAAAIPATASPDDEQAGRLSVVG
jgi:hypothetical protein